MIRPITCLTFLLACGSGLYLYQSKHRVDVLDRQIEQIAANTNQVREQTRMLRAEWTLLNDPARLRQLAAQFLNLKTVAPTQFTNLAELDAHLPPAGPLLTIPQPETIPVAQAPSVPGAEAPTSQDQMRLANANPHPPVAPAGTSQHDQAAQQQAPPAAIAQSKLTPAVRAPTQSAPEPSPSTEQRRTTLARSAPVSRGSGADSPRSPEERAMRHGSEPRHAQEAHRVIATTRIPSPTLSGGSLLGMARTGAAPPAPAPLPRPVPGNGPVYVNGG